MPDKLIAARGHFSERGRGRTAETKEELAVRKSAWKKSQRRIREWNRLYDQLEGKVDSFVSLIGDNEFLPEKFLGITSELHKKLYLLYLTTPRIVTLMGMLEPASPTFSLVKHYITVEFPDIYKDVVAFVCDSTLQSPFKNFVSFFGEPGVHDLLNNLGRGDYDADKQFQKWHLICKKIGIDHIDFELIRIYRRFVDVGVLDISDHCAAQKAIDEMDMLMLATLLEQKFEAFKQKIFSMNDQEIGQKLLNSTSDAIFKNIQIKFSQFLEE